MRLLRTSSQCLFTITEAETLHPDFEQLEREGTEPEHVIMSKLLSMFGPLPWELVTHVDDDFWVELMTVLAQLVAQEDPGEHLSQWDEENYQISTPRRSG